MSDPARRPTETVRHLSPDSNSGRGVQLRALTPARVGLGRTGVSLETSDLLDFQRCHAQARDAVHARLESAALAAALVKLTGGTILRLHSAAADRVTYLQRPDLGRTLDEPSRTLLEKNSQAGGSDLALIVADGLSALAVERHALPLLAELLPRLEEWGLEGWRLAPISIVEQGRVAIGDEIGAALDAEIAVVLIGERPGLSSPDSLGAYITWNPKSGRSDSERNCISNIRPEGLSYAQAAAQLGFILAAARRLRLTGVALKIQAPPRVEQAPRAKEIES
jgi:ethanolamine ammonia-lyase small subunit